MSLQSASLDRRQFLGGAAVVAAGAVILSDTRIANAAAPRGNPFGLGVASGDPLPDGIVLWTRLVNDPQNAASMGVRNIPVAWQLAEDEAFTSIARQGTTTATPALAHSVHVDVRGLRPARDYFYRFRSGTFLSPVGRTRTAPAAASSPAALRLGIVNCQDFQNGYWPAYTHLAEEDLDVVVHLGDYIYEYDPDSRFPDRLHNAPQTPGLDQLRTLADYRNRHALYKGDEALRNAHARFPWIMTWDDHETENNYATLTDEIDDTGAMKQTPAQFAVQRAAAYQAYYEHMPIRPAAVPGSPAYQIYRAFDFGDLLRVAVLDTRQYRTDQPGGFPGDFGPAEVGLANTTGTLTGPVQEAWLRSQLRGSGARWNAIAQQVMMSPIAFPTGDPTTPVIANLDQWDGYAPQRQRLIDFLRQDAIVNPVVLAGDIHSSWFSDLPADLSDPTSATVAVEFTATSVSSDFPIEFDAPIKALNPTLNPQVKYFDGALRGYLRMTVDADRWLTEARTVATIETRDAPVATTAAYVTEAGNPGLTPA